MTEYKIQHFIPQWLFRNFGICDSTDSRRKIWVYNLIEKSFKLELISQSGQDDYFYGLDGKFEKFLQSIENETFNGVQAAIRTENLNELAKPTLERIRCFILLQASRTEAMKIIIQNFVEGYLENEIKPKLKVKYQNFPEFLDYIDDLKLGENFFDRMIRINLGSKIIISDLKMILIKNNTRYPFLLGDHPIVKNNYFYRRIPVHGLQTPGIQIYCPISTNLCLLLIHDEVYHIQLNTTSKILLNKESDINSLNRLQILNCYKQIFSPVNNSDYIKSIYDESTEILRKLDGSRFKRKYDDITERNFQIHFNFLKRRHNIDRLLAKYRNNSMMSKKHNPIRNHILYRKGWEKTDKIDKALMNEYQNKIELEYNREELFNDRKYEYNASEDQNV